ISGLPRIDDCADARWLLEVVPPPADLEVRARLERTRDLLARAQTERDLGRLDATTALLERVVPEARAIGYPPLLTEALVLETEVMRTTGHTVAAEAEAWLAVEAALASRDQRLQAQAWLSLAETVGIVMRRFTEAERLFAVARSAIAPLARPAALEARWLRGSAHFLEIRGDAQSAVPRYLEAIAAYERLEGAPRGAQAWLWRRLGETQLSAERPSEAEAALRKSIALGEADPTGSSQLDRALVSLADVLREQRRFDEARSLLERALPLARKGGSWTSPVVALYTLGHLERDAGNLNAAAEWFQRYLALVETLPSPNPYLGDALTLLGEVQLAQGAPASAEPLLRKAVAAFDRFGMHDDVETLFARTALARALIANGHRAEAITVMEHAVRLLEGSTSGAAETAKGRFRVARALWELGRDRPKALALAKAAREAGGPSTRAEIDAWLEQHERRRSP
ncbi:MAG: tetratricopeptide repeat protein, partial [Myxococcaceae bacterium]|nr:tetratricopeptide repeat protein [Myxococcaceae bacterium]